MLSTLLSVAIYFLVVVLCLTFDLRHNTTGYYLIFGLLTDVAKNYLMAGLFLTKADVVEDAK